MKATRSTRQFSRLLRNLFPAKTDVAAVVFAIACLLLVSACPINAARERADSAPAVTVTQTGETYTLTNGFVMARVDRRSGDLVSLKYQEKELFGSGSGHPAAYWSHTPTRGGRTVFAITIDPGRNAGERAEVSVKGFYTGTALGQGPGGSAAADIEIVTRLGETITASIPTRFLTTSRTIRRPKWGKRALEPQTQRSALRLHGDQRRNAARS